jgi:hypothetical protein
MEIRTLSRFFPTKSHSDSSPILEDLDILSIACSLMQRLLQMEPGEESGSLAAHITECCRLAAALFLFFLFENHRPDSTRLINSLVHKLQTALSSILTSTRSGNTLMIWLLSVGGVAALNLPAERDWFVSHLAELAAELELKSWDEMNSCLRVVVWIDVMDDYPFLKLWEEILVNVSRATTEERICALGY